jgi:hypothetical protein
MSSDAKRAELSANVEQETGATVVSPSTVTGVTMFTPTRDGERAQVMFDRFWLTFATIIATLLGALCTCCCYRKRMVRRWRESQAWRMGNRRASVLAQDPTHKVEWRQAIRRFSLVSANTSELRKAARTIHPDDDARDEEKLHSVPHSFKRASTAHSESAAREGSKATSHDSHDGDDGSGAATMRTPAEPVLWGDVMGDVMRRDHARAQLSKLRARSPQNDRREAAIEAAAPAAEVEAHAEAAAAAEVAAAAAEVAAAAAERGPQPPPPLAARRSSIIERLAGRRRSFMSSCASDADGNQTDRSTYSAAPAPRSLAARTRPIAEGRTHYEQRTLRALAAPPMQRPIVPTLPRRGSVLKGIQAVARRGSVLVAPIFGGAGASTTTAPEVERRGSRPLLARGTLPQRASDRDATPSPPPASVAPVPAASPPRIAAEGVRTQRRSSVGLVGARPRRASVTLEEPRAASAIPTEAGGVVRRNSRTLPGAQDRQPQGAFSTRVPFARDASNE